MSLKKKSVKQLKEDMSAAQLQAKLNEDKIKREGDFGKEFNELRKKYNCDVRPVVTIKSDRIMPGLEIVAL